MLSVDAAAVTAVDEHLKVALAVSAVNVLGAALADGEVDVDVDARDLGASRERVDSAAKREVLCHDIVVLLRRVLRHVLVEVGD